MYNNDYYSDSYYSNDVTPGSYSAHIVVKPNSSVRGEIFFSLAVIAAMCLIYWKHFKSTIDTPQVFWGYSLFLILPISFSVLTFINSIGKKFEVNGYSATVTKMLFMHEEISINDIREAELVTGLRTGGRRPHKDYNNLVIYYKSKSIKFADIKYDGWREMVDYLDSVGKLKRIDGRSSVRKFMDDRF